jgi:uncharacterized phiE125 gp8 family phage protein
MSILRRIGAAGTPPVTLASAKEHLRVTHDLEDALITALIAAACDAVGQSAGRVVALETWEIADERFCGEVELPKSPVIALTSIKYYSADTLVTASLSDYRLYLSDDYSCVAPLPGTYWPNADIREDGTIIRFTAGYSTLPETLRQAVLLMVGHLYKNREAVGDAGDVVPLALEYLIGVERLGWVAA